MTTKKCKFWWPCDLCRNMTLACALWWGTGMVLGLGLKGKKKCRSGTKEKQLRGKVMTLSSQYLCTDMLPPARNSLIWPEIILI